MTAHELLADGAPYRADGRRRWAADPETGRALGYDTEPGTGCGKCSCGELSEPLSTDLERKRWFRTHSNT